MKKASKGGRTLTRRAKVTGFGLMAGAGMTAWRSRQQRHQLRPFLEWDGPSDPTVDVGVARIALPIRYWRTDCFLGVFPADYGAVRDMLPSSRLHPVRLLGSKAAIAVVAYDYIETGVGPYGEIGLVPLCTLDRVAPPVLPLLQDRSRGMGGFVAHLPVTSRVACEAGRSIWGYPKFVADMAFDVSPERQEVTLAEAGRNPPARRKTFRAGRTGAGPAHHLHRPGCQADPHDSGPARVRGVVGGRLRRRAHPGGSPRRSRVGRIGPGETPDRDEDLPDPHRHPPCRRRHRTR